MPEYSYSGRDRNGRFVEGLIEGTEPDNVAGHLLETGITPIRIQIHEEQEDALVLLRKWLTRDRVSIDDLVTLSRQLAALTRAGIPVVQAIIGLSESCRSPGLAAALSDVARQLKAGHELSRAFAMHPKTFPPLITSIMQLGEKAGMLEQTFLQIAFYLEQDRNTRKHVKSAVRYPLTVLGAIGIAMIVINVFVVPAFKQAFESFHAELPIATRILIASSNAVLSYWPHALVAIAGTFYVVRSYLRTDEGRYHWDRWKLRIPLVGRIFTRATLARYARAFSMASRSGMPVLQILQAVAKAVGNRYVSEGILALRGRIERGETLTRAATASGLFTPLVLQMMGVGEESGTVAEMHVHIAESYEEEVAYDLKRLGDWIEPVLIIVIGGIVFVLALGVYMPLWDLGANAFKR